MHCKVTIRRLGIHCNITSNSGKSILTSRANMFLAKKTAMLVLYLSFAGLIIVTSEGAAIDGESVVANQVQFKSTD